MEGQHFSINTNFVFLPKIKKGIISNLLNIYRAWLILLRVSEYWFNEVQKMRQ
jgi:hypothetical protein